MDCGVELYFITGAVRWGSEFLGIILGANSREAINRIYEMKGRKHTSLLAICVGDVLDTKLFAVIADLPDGLLNSLLPGPVTMVLRRGCGSALALKSANLSGRPSSFCIEDFESSWEHCAYVYDGGELPSDHVGSTVVDLTKLGNYMILRSGSAGEETIAILKRHSLQEEARVVESLVIGSRLQGSVK
ncbi:hypothetical protein Ancab_008306 [Ancistrocladus abbreviatus]